MVTPPCPETRILQCNSEPSGLPGVEDPNFQLFWYGLNRMFLNRLLFLGEAR